MTTEIQEYSQTEAALAELRKQFKGNTYDVTTVDGMKQAKSDRGTIRSYRTSLEKVRKEIKGPALERCRLIDTEAKRITEALLELETPIADQIQKELDRQERELQEKAEREQRRVEGIVDRIAEMSEAPDKVGIDTPPDEIRALLDWLSTVDTAEGFDEFTDRAEETKKGSQARLEKTLAEAEKYAAEQAELAELRRQKEEQAEREAAQRRAAEEQARKDQEAERKRLAKQREAQEAEERKLREEREAFERQQREEQERRERERRELAKKQAEAAELAKRSKYPGDEPILIALSEHFDVPYGVVDGWLRVNYGQQ